LILERGIFDVEGAVVGGDELAREAAIYSLAMITRRSFSALLAASAAFGVSRSEFPLAVTTDEIDEDLGHAIAVLKEFKLKYAEVRNLWGKYNTAQPLDRVKEARRMFDDAGIRLAILDTGFFKIPLPGQDDRSVMDNQWALLGSAMERAHILGTDLIRIFAFTYDKNAKPDHAVYPRIYELVEQAAGRAKGFRLAVENVGGSYVWTGAQSAALLKAVIARNLGLVWDPNNAATAGEKSFPDGYRQLDVKRVWHIHLRDFKPNAKGDMEWCAVGDGVFDNAAQLRALAKDGFRGTYSLETHYKSPLGKEHATRTSLKALLETIDRV
jgi:sugar phosphate isomerase/epimerase